VEKTKTLTLLFYHKKVAKSSVKGLSICAPLLKTDRFGDPTPRRRLPHGLLTLVASVSTSPVFSSLYLCLKHAPKARGSRKHLHQASAVNLECFGFDPELSRIFFLEVVEKSLTKQRIRRGRFFNFPRTLSSPKDVSKCKWKK